MLNLYLINVLDAHLQIQIKEGVIGISKLSQTRTKCLHFDFQIMSQLKYLKERLIIIYKQYIPS